MIHVVGANPAMDRISRWPPLQLGHVNRAADVSVVAGGKGLNVARAVARLGPTPAAYGFLGGEVGAAVRSAMAADGVVDRHTEIAASTRVCFIVVEPDVGRATVLNEPGPAVAEAEVRQLLDDVGSSMTAGDLLIVSGSLPDSVSTSVVGELLQLGQAAGARTLVDIHSEALRVALARRPWLLKCNRAELAALVGEPTAIGTSLAIPELAAEMLRIRDHGIEVMVVSLGPEGALLADAEGVVHAHPPRIAEVNPTGSGDLLLAGLAVSLEEGGSTREALTLGVACGTAGATHLLPELPPGFRREAWLADVRIEEVVGR